MTMTRRPALAMSIGQMLKLVAFAAGASACIAPAVRLWQMGAGEGYAFVLLEAVLLPLAMFALGLLLLRRGRFRDRFVIGSLTFSVVAALVVAIMRLSMLVQSSIGTGGRFRPDVRAMGETILIILILGAAVGFLILILQRTFERSSLDRMAAIERDREGGGTASTEPARGTVSEIGPTTRSSPPDEDLGP